MQSPQFLVSLRVADGSSSLGSCSSSGNSSSDRGVLRLASSKARLRAIVASHVMGEPLAASKSPARCHTRT